MLGYFTFKGLNSTLYNNLIVDYKNIIFKAGTRNKQIYTLNRNGAYTFLDGLNNFDIEIKCTLTTKNILTRRQELRALSSWLTGSGNLVLGIEPDVYYEATVISEFNSNIQIALDEFNVVFSCKPVRKAVAGSTVSAQYSQTSASTISVVNSGNTLAYPIIMLSGTITSMTIANRTLGKTMTVTTNIAGTNTYIDTENLLVYSIKSGVTANRVTYFSGDFFGITAGTNSITITGTFQTGTIQVTYRNAYV